MRHFLGTVSIFLSFMLVRPALAEDDAPVPINFPENYSKIHLEQLTARDIALRLGWKNNPLADNFCRGYYVEPALHYEEGLDLPENKRPIRLSFDDSEYTTEGKSIFSGDVVITQPDRSLIADITHLYRDADSGSFS